jgi:hypothetical protein
MAITPSILVALNGLTQGNGFVVNTAMTTSMAVANANPLISSIASLKTAPNYSTTAGLVTAVNSLPSFIANVGNVAASVTTQALGMLPESSTLGSQDFILLFNQADNYVSTTAQISSALAQFDNKSFGSMGIGVKNYSQVITSGVPESLIKLGPAILNFGTVFDFANLQTLGTPQNLISSLLAQGFDRQLGINLNISQAGYAGVALKNVPASVLNNILNNISGTDLATVISHCNVTTCGTVNTGADLLLIESYLAPSVIAASGLDLVGNAGIINLANALLNLGMANATAAKYSDFLSALEVPSLTHLGNLTTVLPVTVTANLIATLGTGTGKYNNPVMTDLIGTVAGVVHTESFANIVQSANTVSTATVGRTLTSTATALRSALVLNSGVASATTAFTNAVLGFNTAINTPGTFATAVLVGNQAIADSLTQLTTELNNLSIAGISLYSGTTTTGTSPAEFMSFVTKLHDYGTDRGQFGYNTIISGMVSNDLTGDAIQAALVEGRNIATSQTVGKTTPAVHRP